MKTILKIKLDGNIIEELETAINENEEIKLEISSKSFKFKRNCAIKNITQNRVNDISISNTETKRYRLVIPEDLKGWKAHLASTLEVVIVEILFVQHDVNYSIVRDVNTKSEQLCLSEWLVEIKEESRPCTAKEYADSAESIRSMVGSVDIREIRIESFEAGEKANELKHRKTESFSEIIELKFGAIGINRRDFDIHDLEIIWKAADKSRGCEQ